MIKNKSDWYELSFADITGDSMSFVFFEKYWWSIHYIKVQPSKETINALRIGIRSFVRA